MSGRVFRVEVGRLEYTGGRAALEDRYEIAVEDRDPERTIGIFRLKKRNS